MRDAVIACSAVAGGLFVVYVLSAMMAENRERSLIPYRCCRVSELPRATELRNGDLIYLVRPETKEDFAITVKELRRLLNP